VKKNPLKALKNFSIFIAAKAGFLFALALPRSFGLWLFGSLARLVFLFPNTEKVRTFEHLRLVFGASWTEEKIRTIAKNVYISLGKNLFDAVKLSHASQKKFNDLVKHDDLAPFQKAFDRGRGMIVITAHVGCFEMLLHFFARHGFKSLTVGTRSFDSHLDGLIRSLRSGKDIEYMDRTESPRKIIRWLKEGGAFGVLIDQDTKVEGVFAPFLGIPAYTPSAPVRMAMHFKVPAIVATTVRRDDGAHYVYLSDVLEFADTGDFERDLVTNVGLANDLICKTIMRYPEQWVWMHRRWKTKPPAAH
jgi:KDO2-lipid IV(A) lauroyltransferase